MTGITERVKEGGRRGKSTLPAQESVLMAEYYPIIFSITSIILAVCSFFGAIMRIPRILLFVLDRGFIVIGRAQLDPELEYHWLLSPGRTVRRWGTTQGLAELKNGPLSNTVLDVETVHHVPFRSVISILNVEENSWEAHLTGATQSLRRAAR